MKVLLNRFTLVPLLCMAALLTGCAHNINPIAAAEGPDEKGYAVLGVYRIAQTQALKIVQDATLPATVREAVQSAEASAYPVVTQLAGALVEYLEARDQVAAGTTSEEKLAIVISRLSEWTATAQARIAGFQAAIGSARS